MNRLHTQLLGRDDLLLGERAKALDIRQSCCSAGRATVIFRAEKENADPQKKATRGATGPVQKHWPDRKNGYAVIIKCDSPPREIWKRHRTDDRKVARRPDTTTATPFPAFHEIQNGECEESIYAPRSGRGARETH